MGKGRTQARLLRQAGKRIERHLEKVPVKPVSAFTVIGRAPRRKDALEKVTGKAQYAADMALPGTLHAHVLRPPAHGATLKEIDTTMGGARRLQNITSPDLHS
jgi:nicotinate dehydrogenase subunit B